MNDYLEHYNHNHDALGRFARSAGSASSSIGRKLSGKKDKNNTIRKYDSAKRLASKKTKASNVKVAKKKKGSKSNNTKLSDSERRRLIESASLKEVTANKDKLSNRELEKAINRLQTEKVSRINLEKQLADLNNPANQKNKQTAIEKIDKWGKDAEKLANAINSGTKLYNNFANVYNLGKPDSQKLPRIGNEKDGNKRTRSWVQTIVDSGDAVKAAKYANQMTADERKKVVDSLKDSSYIYNQGNKMDNKSTESSKSSSSNNESSSKKESNPSIESYDNERDYERAVRTNNNYGNGGWKTYDSQGREWTTYDYKSNQSSSSSNETKKQESKVDNILEKYPDYNDDWKKRKNRY